MSEPTYKGTDEVGYFYWPGMTEEQKKRLHWELSQRSKVPSDIQRFIMKQAGPNKDIKE